MRNEGFRRNYQVHKHLPFFPKNLVELQKYLASTNYKAKHLLFHTMIFNAMDIGMRFDGYQEVKCEDFEKNSQQWSIQEHNRIVSLMHRVWKKEPAQNGPSTSLLSRTRYASFASWGILLFIMFIVLGSNLAMYSLPTRIMRCSLLSKALRMRMYIWGVEFCIQSLINGSQIGSNWILGTTGMPLPIGIHIISFWSVWEWQEASRYNEECKAWGSDNCQGVLWRCQTPQRWDIWQPWVGNYPTNTAICRQTYPWPRHQPQKTLNIQFKQCWDEISPRCCNTICEGDAWSFPWQ